MAENEGSSLDDVMAKFDRDAKEQAARAAAIEQAKASDDALTGTTATPAKGGLTKDASSALAWAKVTRDAPTEATASAPAEAAAPATYVVQAGDSLSAISEKVYGDVKYWSTIFEHNKDKISDPNVIHPGQELLIP